MSLNKIISKRVILSHFPTSSDLKSCIHNADTVLTLTVLFQFPRTQNSSCLQNVNKRKSNYILKNSNKNMKKTSTKYKDKYTLKLEKRLKIRNCR
jgi:hypothetical protein